MVIISLIIHEFLDSNTFHQKKNLGKSHKRPKVYALFQMNFSFFFIKVLMILFQFELSIYLYYSFFLVLKEIKSKRKTIDEIIS